MKSKEKQNETKNPQNKSIRNSIRWMVVVFILLVVTLPFHYVPSALMVFPKNELTFSHTIITQKDIDELVERMNTASYQQQQAMRSDPFVLKLMEKGLILED